MLSEISNPLKKIWPILPAKSKRQLILLVGLLTVATVLEMIGIGLILPLLGTLLPNMSNGQDGGGSLVREIISHFKAISISVIALFLVLTFTIKNIYLALLNFYQSKLIFGLEAYFSGQLLEIYLQKSIVELKRRSTGHLLRNLTIEVSQMCHSTLAPLCNLLAEILVCLGIFILIVVIDPVGAILASLILLTVAALFHLGIRNPVARWGGQRQLHEGMRLKKLGEYFDSIRQIKLSNLEGDFKDDYMIHASESANSGRYLFTTQSLPRLFLEISAVWTLIILFIIGTHNKGAMIIPILGVYALAIFRLMPSTNRILNSLQSIRFSKASTDLVCQELLDRSPCNSGRFRTGGSLAEFKSNIILSDISFRYPGESEYVIRNLNFRIDKGDFIHLVGRSGAGKSTLLDLISGFVEPTAGSITCDGRDVSHNSRMRMGLFAYASQTTALVDGTILQNVTLGIPEDMIDLEILERVISTCGLTDIVRAESENKPQTIGERGMALSGGQRQRVGIARELYRCREILILDEATNALDSESEASILSGIIQNFSSTLIFVTHRPVSDEFTPRIVQLSV